jgi:protein involved in polysaccharide export with SLBB domain
MGDAFTARAVLTREKADYSLETLPVDVGAILSGVAADVELRNGDWLHIPSVFDLREKYTVTVKGAVQKPGEYDYAENLTVEDLIIAAGGVLESASTAKADVYRRIKQPGSISESDFRSESFTVPIHTGLEVGPGGDFAIRPFDMVVIRTSPGYERQKPVAVLGEVLFPGDYTLVKREERLSDLVRKSGGALSSAYLQGAKLIRKRAEDEQTRAQSALRLTQMSGRDSLSSAALNVAQNYSVGIELDKALAYPGSDYDLVLTDGDVLFVPEYVGTVAVSGAVLFPNTVSYREGMSIKDYIDQAGGYAHRARKKAQIVVYMNGTISRVRWSGKARIAPGCEIVVPYKSARGGRRVSLSDLLSVGSSATSAASLITSITGL